MFTVKLIQAGITSIRTVKEITIARPGSASFKEAMGYAKEVGVKKPNYVEYVPGTLEPKDHGKPQVLSEDLVQVQEEQILENGEREGVIGDPIAVILEDSSPLCIPFNEAFAGTAYTFLYRGDEFYVMNGSGATIEAIK